MNSILSPGKEFWDHKIDEHVTYVKSLDTIFADEKIPLELN